jgi:hypothetical protein
LAARHQASISRTSSGLSGASCGMGNLLGGSCSRGSDRHVGT